MLTYRNYSSIITSGIVPIFVSHISTGLEVIKLISRNQISAKTIYGKSKITASLVGISTLEDLCYEKNYQFDTRNYYVVFCDD